jgi:hypothetical protein
LLHYLSLSVIEIISVHCTRKRQLEKRHVLYVFTSRRPPWVNIALYVTGPSLRQELIVGMLPIVSMPITLAIESLPTYFVLRYIAIMYTDYSKINMEINIELQWHMYIPNLVEIRPAVLVETRGPTDRWTKKYDHFYTHYLHNLQEKNVQ